MPHTSVLTSISSNIILGTMCVWIMSSFQYYPTINLWFKTGVPTLSLWFHSCTSILKCLRIWIPMSLIWKTVSLDSQNLTRLLKFHSNRMTVTVWHFWTKSHIIILKEIKRWSFLKESFDMVKYTMLLEYSTYSEIVIGMKW